MNESQLVLILASIVAQAAPLMLAITGETLTERVGVINLSLDGTMLLTAMSGFVTALLARQTLEAVGISGNFLPVLVGFAVSAIIGMLAALLVAWGSARLKQDQVAIGFVLTLLLADLANFLGQNYTRKPGPSVAHLAIPVLSDLPILGPMLFKHDLLIYAIFLIVGLTWFVPEPG